MAFTVTSKIDGQQLHVNIVGNIDEDSSFQPLDLGAAAAVVIDLEAVSAINSVGIREWIKWIKQIPSSLKFSVRKCPKIIVDQINMVSGFLPTGAVVESFYVPYYADASGEEKMVLFTNGKEYGTGKVNPPSDVKDGTGEVMEMDVIEAKYFKFLNG